MDEKTVYAFVCLLAEMQSQFRVIEHILCQALPSLTPAQYENFSNGMKMGHRVTDRGDMAKAFGEAVEEGVRDERSIRDLLIAGQAEESQRDAKAEDLLRKQLKEIFPADAPPDPPETSG